MTISEVAKKLGLTPHTLRYYEKIGLIRDVARRSGKRDYSPADVVWLEFIQRLKATSMPLKEIRQYSQLRYAGIPPFRSARTCCFPISRACGQKSTSSKPICRLCA